MESGNISDSVIGVMNYNGNLNINGDLIVYGSDSEDLQYVELDVPPLIKTFKGREEDMNNIDMLLFSKIKRKLVICGLPGYGKTELVKQYANNCLSKKKVDKIFWMNAENPGDLQKATLKKAYKHFHDKRCIFIFDNGIKRQDILQYEPPDNDNFYLLITSQESDWDDDIDSVKLETLSAETSIEIYKTILCDKYKEDDLDLYTTLAFVVGCVPLGLQITGNCIRQEMKRLGNDFQLKDYIKNLKESQEMVMNTKIPTNVPNSYTKSIYGAICVSIEKINNENDDELRELALNTMFICSYFDPDKINVDELLKVANIKEILDKNQSDKKQYKRALYILANFSFINYHPNETIISIHRLTQDVLRFHINSEPKYYMACLRYVFSQEIPENNFFDFWILLSHAEYNVSKVHLFHNELIPKNGNIKWLINSVVDMFKTGECNTENNELLRNFLQGLVMYGNIECIKRIFSEKSNHKYINSCHLLHIAAKRNITVILEYLLQFADINTVDENKDTALHAAARKWYMEAINCLIKHKANTNIKNNLGNTPLFTLTENETFFQKYLNWAETLKLFKYEKNTVNNNKEGITHLAALYYRVELLNVLLTEYEEDPNQQDIKGRTPLHFIATAEYFNLFTQLKLSCAKLLVLHGATFPKDENGETTEAFFLHAAIKYNDLELLKLLLRNGASVNSKDKRYEDTPLHIALESRNYEAMKILIPYNPEIEAQNKFNCRAIINFFLFASLEDAVDVFNTFMQNEEHFSINNERFLRLAVTNCREDMLRYLIPTYKFNTNTKNSYGNTPLHCLVYMAICYPERYTNESLKSIADYLIEQGAKSDIKNIDGKTPKDLVLENNIEFLKSCFDDK